MELIVDGYNVIGVEQGLGGVLEAKRNWLLQRLSAYGKKKRIGITVVFDGWRSGSSQETSQKKDGISIVYSRLNEKADDVIIRLAKGKAGGTVVITSDREIRNAVERFGAVAIASAEFAELLRRLDEPYEAEEDFDESDSGEHQVKRGSRTERRRREAWRKLRL